MGPQARPGTPFPDSSRHRAAAGTPSASPPPIRAAPPPHHTDDDEATPGTGPLGPRWGREGPDLGRGRAAGHRTPPRRPAAKGSTVTAPTAGSLPSQASPPPSPAPGRRRTRGYRRARRRRQHPGQRRGTRRRRRGRAHGGGGRGRRRGAPPRPPPGEAAQGRDREGEVEGAREGPGGARLGLGVRFIWLIRFGLFGVL